jgi:hypothetical protein
MPRAHFKAASIAIAGAAILAACHGTGSYTPTSQTAQSDIAQTHGAVEKIELVPSGGVSGRSADLPAGIPACKAKPVPVPGTYISYGSSGKVKHATYTGSKTSMWESLQYTKATPPPSPSPSPTVSPTTGPTPAPEYIYYGTYAVKKSNGGCAYLVTTQSGKLFRGLKNNGLVIGSVKIAAAYYHASFVASGPMTITIGKLSQSGGRGSFALINSKGKTFNTGTVTLVGRLLIK